jgi:hypothetical protein
VSDHDTPEYQQFVEEMAKLCRCYHPNQKPCDGVLAGGLCDLAGHEPDFTMDELEWSEEYE